MNRSAGWIIVAALLLAGLPARAEDDRSTEILRYDCLTDTTRREVTLFANGTIRLRDGVIRHEWMGLAELGPDEMTAYLNRLAGEDLSQERRPERGVEGNWIERCELKLPLPGKPQQSYRFGHYDPLPLNLSRVVRIVKELEEKVQVLREAEGKQELPVDYEPRPGDVLKRLGDGALFRIVAFTGDSKGVELQGIDLPLQMFVPKDQMRQNFTAVVSRGR
ncbi:MAG TPA: hypothetical protein VG477_00760 [Thermoanaerobaculia bacterium]|nr:hypothetical protein [Thermoanaerobaculia bacterium]